MDIQTAFYWLGSTFVLMWIIFLLIIIVGTILLYKSINGVVKTAEEKMTTTMGSVLRGLVPLLPIVIEMIRKRKKA